jgi:hypothetical protein
MANKNVNFGESIDEQIKKYEYGDTANDFFNYKNITDPFEKFKLRGILSKITGISGKEKQLFIIDLLKSFDPKIKIPQKQGNWTEADYLDNLSKKLTTQREKQALKDPAYNASSHAGQWKKYIAAQKEKATEAEEEEEEGEEAEEEEEEGEEEGEAEEEGEEEGEEEDDEEKIIDEIAQNTDIKELEEVEKVIDEINKDDNNEDDDFTNQLMNIELTENKKPEKKSNLKQMTKEARRKENNDMTKESKYNVDRFFESQGMESPYSDYYENMSVKSGKTGGLSTKSSKSIKSFLPSANLDAIESKYGDIENLNSHEMEYLMNKLHKLPIAEQRRLGVYEPKIPARLMKEEDKRKLFQEKLDDELMDDEYKKYKARMKKILSKDNFKIKKESKKKSKKLVKKTDAYKRDKMKIKKYEK